MEIKDLIVRYGVIVSRRFYPKEKLRFLRGSVKEFMDVGMKVDIKEASKNQRKAYNFYAGDINKAGLTISAYYDTPPKTFGMFKHSVYCPKSDNKAFAISVLIPVFIIMTFGGLLIQFLSKQIWMDNVFNVLDILVMVPLIVLLFLLLRFRNGIGNRANLVRNSASLISCIKLVEALKPKERNKIGIAFTDYGCINHFGDDMLRDMLKENADKNTVIFLDCTCGDGDVLVLYSKACAYYVKKVKMNSKENIVFHEISENDTHYYSLFKKTIVLTSGKLENGIVQVNKVNTTEDNDVNEANLGLTIHLLKEFVLKYVEEN